MKSSPSKKSRFNNRKTTVVVKKSKATATVTMMIFPAKNIEVAAHCLGSLMS